MHPPCVVKAFCMKTLKVALLLCVSTAVLAANPPAKKAVAPSVSTASYVITNDDLPFKAGATSGTLFTIASDGSLSNPNRISLGNSGAGGGYYNAARVSVLQSSTDACAFLSSGGGGTITVIDLATQQNIGTYTGSDSDAGIANGIGLVNNGTYLYASYSSSNTVATFAISSGCTLTFLGDISPIGLHTGNVKGMAVHGNVLVLTYGDGSIQSFNVANGIPVSNGDLQNATGYTTSRFPTGVDITKDGHYAIFGDMASDSSVEVSDMSSGKLTKTKLYSVGTGQNSDSIYLSPDETLLYIANTGNGRVSAAFFNATTGAVTPGCISATLKQFDNKWIFLSSPVTQLNSGTGSVLYLAEFGSSSGVAVVDVTSSGGKCTLTEAKNSPVQDPDSTTLLSIQVYPPRSF
jgi:6-phosphogluconolactonase (cycloisomerase 2 family)